MAFEWPRVPQACGTRVTSVILTPDFVERADHVYVGMPCRYTADHPEVPIGPFGKP